MNPIRPTMDPARHRPRQAIRFFTGPLGNDEATTVANHPGFSCVKALKSGHKLLNASH
jgi:hypothetical protein